MKKYIMSFVLFSCLIILAACGGDNGTTIVSESGTNTNETTATTDNEKNVVTTSVDSSENLSEIAENTTVTEEFSSTQNISTPTISKTNSKTTENISIPITKTDNSTKTTAPTEPKIEPSNNGEKEETITNTTPKPTTATTNTTKTDAKPEKIALSHDDFDELLRKYVNNAGRVNYAGFKNEKAKLLNYLEHLGDNPPKSSWSKNKEMAFWINLYNAFTIKVILDKYPIKSIMDLNGGKVWDVQKVTIGGKSYTLGQIEAEQLLKRFKEPRVHFAVNCAAASCPPLLNKAWTESNIQQYYEKQAKIFINHNGYNTLSAKSVQLSQIFNWYASDFGGAGNVLKYIQKYSDTSIKDKAKVSYREYDWNLNKQ